MNDFIAALKNADKTFVFEIECDREKAEDFGGVTSKTIVDNIPNAEMIDTNSINKLLEYKDAVLCFMSCADIAKYEHKFVDMLPTRIKK